MNRDQLQERMLSYPLNSACEQEIKAGRMYRYVDLQTASYSRLPTLEEVMPFYIERINLLTGSGATLELMIGRPSRDAGDPLGLVGFVGFKVKV
jgi:hypothetical protein